MAKHIDATQLQAILKIVAARQEGISAPGILEVLGSPMPMRTLQYRLMRLVADKKIVREGNARASVYRVPAPTKQDTDTMDHPVHAAVPLSATCLEIMKYVSQPMSARMPVGYKFDLLDSYRPNETQYLREEERERLYEAGSIEFAQLPAGAYAKRILDRLLIELSWNSSRLEGNTFSILDTKRLIHFLYAADDKDMREIQMILNHKLAIEFLASQDEEIGFNSYTILNLHSILADNLLADPMAPGRLRYRSVGIGGSVYHPLESPQLIEEYFHRLLDKAEAIDNPFEQSFFTMVHFPYLQAFDDVNKRVSRFAANIPLLKSNLSPLTFADVPKGLYVEALLGIYERNQHDLLKDLFLWAYERSAAKGAVVRQSVGEPDPLRFRYRTELRSLVGSVMREPMERKRAFEFVGNWAKNNVAVEDIEEFREMAETELLSIHEGNFARYGIKPSEFRIWSEAWQMELKGIAMIQLADEASLSQELEKNSEKPTLTASG